MKKLLITAAITSLFISGCASVSGWKPTVDPYRDVNAANINVDMKDCEVLANQSSGVVKETLMGAGVGGLIGGGGGAALGMLAGNPALGAAGGAALLGVGGGAYAGIKADDKYKSAFNACMRGRGHTVL